MVAVTLSEFEALAGLGARLRRRRLLAGEPQARAASRVGVSVPTYRKLEQGDPAVQIGIWVRAIGLYGTLSDLDLTPGVPLLADPRVGKVAIANPRLAPYGRAALETLAQYQVADAVWAKAVFGENVSQVNQYIYSRNVDVGFTAKSAVLSPTMRGKGHWIDVPRDTYQPIAQGVVILKHGADNAEADCRRFIQFLASAPAREILAAYGYGLP